MNHETLCRQIGDNTLVAIGAHMFTKTPDSLTFAIRNAQRGLQKLVITLVNDTYTVEYYKWNRKFEVVAHTTTTDVYADSISNVVWSLAK